MALAPASRATKDSNGNITLQNDCANITSFASDYKGYGYTLNQLWGARFLDSIPENSTVDNPEFLLFLDDGSKAIVRIATRSSNGGRVYFENAAKDNNGTWQIKGNQRNYDASIGVRLNKQTDLSTNGWTIPSTYTNSADKGKNVGKIDAYTSRLNFVFNQQGPNGSDVYAVRVTGPGLPSAGIVLARSSSCGTNDYLAFFNNNGELPSLAAYAPAFSSSSAWVLDVANYGSNYKGTEFYKQYRGMTTTGSPSTSTSNNIARDPVDMKDIPDFALYQWEVFTKSSGTTPASSFTSRIITRPLKATEGAKQPWATLNKDALDYLDPTNTTKNGELTTATFSWTLPSATAPAVSSAYLYGSSTAGRMNMGQSVTKLGNTSINLSATSEADGNGYVCSYAKVPAFTATSGYREVGLRQTTDRGLTLQQYSFHTGRAAN